MPTSIEEVARAASVIAMNGSPGTAPVNQRVAKPSASARWACAMTRSALDPSATSPIRIGQASPGWRIWTRPRSITTSPSVRAVWKSAVSLPSSRQIEIVSGSPGSTGRVKRPDMERNRAGSPSHSTRSRARPVTP